MASGLLIKQKQLLAGDGIAINHGETASTISLAENALENAVRIYDATVAEETGVITITDGTQVSELAIGDEIRTPDGVYQKTKDDITTGSIPDDGSHILISGCTDPTAVNGMYVATGEPNTWKNETGNYWISKLDGYGGPWWFIASSQAPANPGASSIHYRAIAAIAQNPWDANFTPSHAAGAISVQKYSDLVSKTDTIDLFEYASLPVEPKNIVQSVNGNKPDASGNVTIETSSGGLTSVSVGNGLTGNGTSSSPVTLDLSNYSTESDISLYTAGPYSVSLFKGLYGITIDTTGITLKSENVSIALGVNITYNDNPQNMAGGFAIVESNGKLPNSILPESTVDLSNYTGALNITATSNAFIRGGTSGNYDITIGDSSHGVTVYAAQNNPTVSLTSFGSGGNIDLNSANINVGGSSGATKITLKSSNVSVEPTTGGGTFSVDVTSSGSVKFTAGNIYFNDNAGNTAGGFAIVGEDGKLPSSIIPVSSNRHPFTSSDLSSNVLTITTTGNVTGVIDDSGKAWNFADEEVTYTDSTVSVDLSGVFARKGIAAPAGTWKLMLYGA